MMVSDNARFGNDALKQMMGNYEKLCGGKNVWGNMVLVITKSDYNMMKFGSHEEWIIDLRDKERKAIKAIYDGFGTLPLGCIAIS